MRSTCGFLAALALTISAGAADIGQLTEQLGASDREQRREAAYQLTLLGAAAKPALPALIRALDDPDKQVWSYAVTTIAALGPQAQEAVPKLIEGLDSRTSRGFRSYDKAQTLLRSADALARIGPAAKPALLTALKSEDAGLRIGAAKALGAMGPAAADTIPALIQNLGDGDVTVRYEASDALGSIGKDAVQPLTESLNSSDAKVRAVSARSLGILGAEASNAGALLVQRAVDEQDVPARAAAVIALPRVGQPQEKVVPILISALKHDQADLNRAAVEALLVIRPAGKTVVPALIALLREPAHASKAAGILARCGPEARPAVPALVELAAKENAASNPYAEALVSLGNVAVPGLTAEISKLSVANVTRDHWTSRTLAAIGLAGLPELQKALASPKPSVRLAALITVEQLGRDARELRPAVAKLVSDPEPTVRAASLGALVQVGGAPSPTLEVIETALIDRETTVRLAAINAAGALKAQARPIAGKVATLLNDNNHEVKIAAIRALGAIGGGGEWIEQLVARLDDPKLQLATVETLGKLQKGAVAPKLIELYPKAERPVRLAIIDALGGAGQSATAILEAALQDGDTELRAAAIRASGKNQPNLDSFVPLLVTALGDPDASVRRAATEAAGAIEDRSSDKILPLVAPLIKVAANDSERVLALDALRSLRVRNHDAIALALESPAAEVRIWGVERFGRLGAEARPMRAKLEPLLRDPNDYIRRAAGRALREIGGR